MTPFNLGNSRLASLLGSLALVFTIALSTAEAQRPASRGDANTRPSRDQRPLTPRRSDVERHDAPLIALLDSLNLSDDQRGQIAAIVKAARADERSRREAAEPRTKRPTEAERLAARERRQAALEQIRGVLTPDQRQRLDETMAERRATAEATRTAATARRVELAPMHQELRQLRREKLLPRIREQRAAFDQRLSSAERAQIASLRTAIHTERTASKTQDKTRPASREAALAQRQARRQQREAFQETHAADFAAVRAIAERHQADLSAVRDSIRQCEVSLQPEIDAIHAKYLTAEEIDTYRARRGQGQRQRHDGPGKSQGEGHERHDRRSPGTRESDGSRDGGHKPSSTSVRGDRDSRAAVAFLLMNPRATAEDADDDEAVIGASDGLGEGPSHEDDRGLSVFPNPAGAETQIAYVVRTAGPVRVDLVDVNGQLLMTLVNEVQAEGSQITSFRRADLSVPASLVRVTDVQGVRTQVVANAQ